MKFFRFFFTLLLIATLSSTSLSLVAFPGGFGDPTAPTPGTPSSATVPSASSSGDFTLSWSNVSGESHFMWREYHNGTWSVWNNTAQNVTSVALSGRLAGSYYYQVKACHILATPQCGAARNSNTITVTLVTIPSKPNSIDISDGSSSSDGSYTVSWSNSTNSPTRYEYQESVDGLWSGTWISTGLSTNTSIAGNGNGTYAYKARACNSAGCSSDITSANVVVSIPSDVGGSGWKNTSGSIPDAAWNGDTPVLNGDSNVGALEAQAGVSGGAATYNIPIVIPPGRAGMQPSVSLNYSSRSGNGVAGVGWSLSAGSSIHRCGSTYAQEGKTKSVTYGTDDKLCLDGQKLIKTSGTYGLSGSQYRTELDSFARITLYGTINSTTSWLKVEYKNGHISKYGTNSQTRHKAGGKLQTMSWAIQETQDLSGNTITYNYNNYGNGEYPINAIHYTGTNGSDGDRQVYFVYETRPDKSNSFLAGGETRITQRLKTIVTKYQSNTIREYRLTYGEQSNATQRSLIRNITECSFRSGSAICLPATSFDWHDSATEFDVKKVWAQTDNSKRSYYPVADLDGDGRKEVLISDSASISWDPNGGLVLGDTQYYIGTTNISGDITALKELVDFDFGYTRKNMQEPFGDINNDGTSEVLAIEKLSNGDSQFVILQLDLQSSNVAIKNKIATGINSVNTPKSNLKYKITNVASFVDINADGKLDLFFKTESLYQQNAIKSRYAYSLNIGTKKSPAFASQVVFTDFPYIQSQSDDTSDQGVTFQKWSDINGDGLQDIIFANNFCNTNSFSQDIFLNTGTGFTTHSFASLGIDSNARPSQTYHQWLDINGDGLEDYVFVPNFDDSRSKTWHYQINRGGSFKVAENTNSTAGITDKALLDWQHVKNACGQLYPNRTPKLAGTITSMDYDNDGIAELILPISEKPAVRFCRFWNEQPTSEAEILVSMAMTTTTLVTAGSAGMLIEGHYDHEGNWVAPYYQQDTYESFLYSDYDNSGLLWSAIIGGTTAPDNTDVYVCAYTASPDGELYDLDKGFWDKSIYKAKGFKFVLQANGKYSLVEVNGDTLYLNNNGPGSNEFPDINGDGLTDATVSTNLTMGMRGSFQWDESLPAGMTQGVGGSYRYISKGAGVNNDFNSPDLLVSVVDGLGNEHQWNYKTLAYERSTGVDFYSVPSLNDPSRYIDDKHFYFTSSMYVVDSFKYSNGIGGLNEKQYSYREAIYNNEGRGLQGFRSIIVDDLSDTDSAKHIRSVSDFHQKFPLAGKLEQTRTCLLVSSGEDCSNNVINLASYKWDLWRDGVKTSEIIESALTDFSEQVFDGNTADNRYLVTPNQQQQIHYATTSGQAQNMSLQGGWTHKNTSTYVFDAAQHGACPKTVNTYYVENAGKQNRTRSEHTYDASKLSEWWYCKLDKQQVTTYASYGNLSDYPVLEPGTDFDKQLETSYIYHATNRKPINIVTNPTIGGGHASQIDTSYNNHGLPLTVASKGKHHTGADMADRNVSTTYTADGYFVNSVTNSKGHVTTTEVDPIHGQATKVTDPNLQETLMTYDAFGRVHSTKLPGEPTQYTAYWWCSGVNGGSAWCLNFPGKQYRVETRQLGSPRHIKYFDSFNRENFSMTHNFDGDHWYYTLNKFNNKGQKTHEATSNGGVSSWQYTYYDSYDALGRLTKKRTPQSDGGHLPTTYQYDGFVTNINAGGLEMARKYNGLGQLVWTKDAHNNYTRYAYDGTGNPITLQDANGNPIYAKYNALGQKEYVDDPNMGKKFFWYNTFGEVEKEKDANLTELTYSYDTLGRMTHRWTNNQWSGRWVYDNTSSAGRLGMLHYEWNTNDSNNRRIKYYYYAKTSSGKDYLSHNTYRTYVNGSYVNDNVFYYVDHNYGRPKGMKYQTTGLTLAYDYNPQGYLSKIKNANGGYVYQEIKDLDNHGKITKQLKTNGLLTESAIDTSVPMYHPATGQMLSIRTATTYGDELRHELTYTYDDFSNLEMQTVRANGVTNSEDYDYDGLHRLVLSQRTINNGTPTTIDPIEYSYDPVGNFTKKGDYVTNYAYGNADKNAGGNAGPNAARWISKKSGGTAVYEYDNNGNMESGDGRTITYNEFNKPLTIEKGTIKSTFSYGADLMRYKQVKEGLPGGVTETTYYVDKLFEKVETKVNLTSTKTVYKHYIGDVAIQTKTITGSNSEWDIRFTHRDRLGSVITLTDDLGNVTEHRSYDAFGKPRKGDYGDLTTPTLYEAVGGEPFTDRGFTDHEHLDDAELIHMNGRAYDYNLGRFLSVDPFILEPGNSQALNPYSYIMNNPFAGTDPTGYFCMDNGKPCKTEIPSYSNQSQPTAATNNGNWTHTPIEPMSFMVWSTDQIMRQLPGTKTVVLEGFSEDITLGNTLDGAWQSWKWAVQDTSNFLTGLTHDYNPIAIAFDIPYAPLDLNVDINKGNAHGAMGVEIASIVTGVAEAKVIQSTAALKTTERVADVGFSPVTASNKKSGVPDENFVPNPNITEKYTRPSNAGPTPAQRASVQGKPCVDCGNVSPTQIADHIDPLVVQYYREGRVNIQQQRQLNAVQPHCTVCSPIQGGQLGAFGKKMIKELDLK